MITPIELKYSDQKVKSISKQAEMKSKSEISRYETIKVPNDPGSKDKVFDSKNSSVKNYKSVILDRLDTAMENVKSFKTGLDLSKDYRDAELF